MADTMTPEERSRCMAAIKGKDTKPGMNVNTTSQRRMKLPMEMPDKTYS